MSIQVLSGTEYELYESAQECKAKENPRKPVGMRHACGCSGRGQEPALCFSFTICMSCRQTDGEASSVWETTRISYMPSSL